MPIEQYQKVDVPTRHHVRDVLNTVLRRVDVPPALKIESDSPHEAPYAVESADRRYDGGPKPPIDQPQPPAPKSKKPLSRFFPRISKGKEKLTLSDKVIEAFGVIVITAMLTFGTLAAAAFLVVHSPMIAAAVVWLIGLSIAALNIWGEIRQKGRERKKSREMQKTHDKDSGSPIKGKKKPEARPAPPNAQRGEKGAENPKGLIVPFLTYILTRVVGRTMGATLAKFVLRPYGLIGIGIGLASLWVASALGWTTPLVTSLLPFFTWLAAPLLPIGIVMGSVLALIYVLSRRHKEGNRRTAIDGVQIIARIPINEKPQKPQLRPSAP